MQMRESAEVRSTTHYWGYRELTADEVSLVGGGYDGDCGPGCGAPGGSGGGDAGGPSLGDIGVTPSPSVGNVGGSGLPDFSGSGP